MYETLAKFIGGKVITALLVVTGLLTCYYFYQNPEKLDDLWFATRSSILWIGFVAVLPWALFFAPGMVLRLESNAASAALLIAYLIVDIGVALWLAGWSIDGTLTWGVVILGFMLAGVYNFLVCDFLAEHSHDQL